MATISDFRAALEAYEKAQDNLRSLQARRAEALQLAQDLGPQITAAQTAANSSARAMKTIAQELFP